MMSQSQQINERLAFSISEFRSIPNNLLD